MVSCLFDNLRWHAKVGSDLKGVAGAGTTITQLIGRPAVFFIKSHRHILYPLMQHAVSLDQVVVRGYSHKCTAATELVQYSQGHGSSLCWIGTCADFVQQDK